MKACNVSMNTTINGLDPVQQRIADSLCALDLKTLNTQIIKGAVGNTGEVLGWSVWPDRNHLNQEWMYDLVWHTKTDDDCLVSLELVLESEWGSKKDVIYDFNKLLLAKSTYKVMVFQGTELAAIDALCAQFIRIIRQFKQTETGEKYLFCAKNKSKNLFVFRSYLTTRDDTSRE